MRSVTKNNLTTPYVHTMDYRIPWNEYPRPHFKRESFINLNGKWDFEITESYDKPKNFSKEILVPFPVESKLSGIEITPDKGEILHYRRFFTLPFRSSERVILNFGAVDQICEVYLNEKQVYSHENGIYPPS